MYIYINYYKITYKPKREKEKKKQRKEEREELCNVWEYKRETTWTSRRSLLGGENANEIALGEQT